MNVRQISVFIENTPGRVAEIARLLGDKGVNVRGFALADAPGYGILRLIVPDPDDAKKLLRDDGLTVTESPVICVEVPDKPGGLADVLEVFAKNDLNVEYMYSIVHTALVFSVEDIDRTVTLLADAGAKVLSQEDIAIF